MKKGFRKDEMATFSRLNYVCLATLINQEIAFEKAQATIFEFVKLDMFYFVRSFSFFNSEDDVQFFVELAR